MCPAWTLNALDPVSERLAGDPPEATHRLEIHALNAFDEVLGGNVDVMVEFEGIEVIEPPRMLGTGTYIALVGPTLAPR